MIVSCLIRWHEWLVGLSTNTNNDVNWTRNIAWLSAVASHFEGLDQRIEMLEVTIIVVP
jgi:hypothetical protein